MSGKSKSNGLTVDEQCPEARPGLTNDLTWLLHRAAQQAKSMLNYVARRHGLSDSRDWVVLKSLEACQGRTQLVLAHDLALDKTTLTAVIDRLEEAGLVVRRVNPADRRARLPEITESGKALAAVVAKESDEAEAKLLEAFSSQERDALHRMLGHVIEFDFGCTEAHGSCM